MKIGPSYNKSHAAKRACVVNQPKEQKKASPRGPRRARIAVPIFQQSSHPSPPENYFFLETWKE